MKCLPGSVPPRATLTCNKMGKKDSCALSCTSKARFLPGTGASATTSMGRGVHERGDERHPAIWVCCCISGGCAGLSCTPGPQHGPYWGERSGYTARVQWLSEGGREVVAQEGSLLGVDPQDRSLVQDLYGRVLGIIPPRHGRVSLHHSGRANTPSSLTESDSSYTVSCGTPVLRQGGQHRATNSSQQCLGKGAPGVPMAATSVAGPCQVAEHLPFLSETVAAPVKQKASFKIKDAKCHLHPRTKGKQEEAGKAGAQGEM